MFMTYLAVLAMSLALTTPPQAQDARAEAERLARSGEHAEALKELRRAESISPSYRKRHEILYAEGQTLLALGRPQEAAAELREAIRLSGGNPAYQAGLAYVLAISGHGTGVQRPITNITATHVTPNTAAEPSSDFKLSTARYRVRPQRFPTSAPAASANVMIATGAQNAATSPRASVNTSATAIGK